MGRQMKGEHVAMRERPKSVTVIAWIVIVWGILALPATFLLFAPEAQSLMQRSPIPLPIQYAMQVSGGLVSIITGIVILKGRNWGRLLYVIWNAVTLVVVLATAPAKAGIVPGLLLFLVVAVVLFRPVANEYFR
jgi:hypothetical protein